MRERADNKIQSNLDTLSIKIHFEKVFKHQNLHSKVRIVHKFEKMAKISPLILILVVMGLIAIHLSQVTSSISTSNQENISDQDVQKLQREHQLGGTKEGINFHVRDKPDYTIFYEDTPSIGIAKSRAIEFTTNDEDHSNVELDKLNDGVRYEILPTESVLNANLIRETDSNNIVRLLSKLISYNRQANDLVRNQIERKRSIRRLAFPKEDKDYSFVLQPLSPMNKYNLAGQRTTKSPRWATQKLRDMILANAKSYR